MMLITAAEFEKRMKEIAENENHNDDIAERHIKADRLLCEVLESFGYSAGVEVYKKMDRWYS